MHNNIVHLMKRASEMRPESEERQLTALRLILLTCSTGGYVICLKASGTALIALDYRLYGQP